MRQSVALAAADGVTALPDIVHELLQLIEPTHNGRYIVLVGEYFPKWKFYREELNRLPVRHENWSD